jgi:signal transduction histidine kinase
LKAKSLKTQVLIWFGTITIIILFFFNYAIYYFLEQNAQLAIQNNLYNKAVFINDKIKTGVPINNLLEDKKLEAFDVAIVKQNKIIFEKGDVHFNSLKKYMMEDKSFFIFKQDNNINGLYIFRITIPFKGSILFYKKNIDTQINKKLQEIKNILFILEPILLFVFVFVANKLIDKILIPIDAITKRANKISVTDLSETIEQPLSDYEIKELVDSFNNMIKRLNDEVSHLDQFNSDVSHELKTPLTVIKGEIELALDKARDSEYYKQSLKTIQQESNTIHTIVDNILMLTKYTKANIGQTFNKISLDNLLLDSVNHYNTQLKKKNIKLHFKKFEPVTIDGNLQLMSIIFSNLIDNAIKYTTENKNIYLSLYKKEKIYFIIKDEGIGISKDKLTTLIIRFYRVDESRNKQIKGFGLWLSIVQKGIELHNGTIKIASKKNKGTIVKVIL